jgi:hypothetical protein
MRITRRKLRELIREAVVGGQRYHIRSFPTSPLMPGLRPTEEFFIYDYNFDPYQPAAGPFGSREEAQEMINTGTLESELETIENMPWRMRR